MSRDGYAGLGGRATRPDKPVKPELEGGYRRKFAVGRDDGHVSGG
jgi:hypothetical protein